MKKINFKNKLSIKKETIAKLNNTQMNAVNGGRPVSAVYYNTCPYSNCAINTGAKCVPTIN
ncbi:MAG TPA: class I lanthipeptide [Bacteroidia bacterium]|nr:class I lanthipeptide [Bacteroidia bacterium]